MALSPAHPIDVSVELGDDEPPTKRLLRSVTFSSQQVQPLPGRHHVRAE